MMNAGYSLRERKVKVKSAGNVMQALDDERFSNLLQPSSAARSKISLKIVFSSFVAMACMILGI